MTEDIRISDLDFTRPSEADGRLDYESRRDWIAQCRKCGGQVVFGHDSLGQARTCHKCGERHYRALCVNGNHYVLVSNDTLLEFGVVRRNGGRATTQGYSAADNVRQKFTRKERDTETNLDYFLARYYSSSQGRFTSPDEFKGGPEEVFGEVDPHNPLFYADTAEPQSLNKYQYCLGNPLRYVDPDGHQTALADVVVGRVTNELAEGAGKSIANTFIGIINFTNGHLRPDAERLEYEKPTNSVQELSMGITDKLTLIGSLIGGRGSATTLTAEGKGSAVVAAARAEANAAQLVPKSARPGAAGALQTGDGQIVTARGGARSHHPSVQKVLDSVPQNQQSKGIHGKCCEPALVSEALNRGLNPVGAKVSVQSVRRPGHPQHGAPKPACPSCKYIMDNFRLEMVP